MYLAVLLSFYSCNKEQGAILKEEATIFHEQPEENTPASKNGCVYNYNGVTTLNEFMSIASENVYPFNLLSTDTKIKFANSFTFLQTVNCGRIIIGYKHSEVIDKLSEKEYNHFIQATFKFNLPSYRGIAYIGDNPFDVPELQNCETQYNEKPKWNSNHSSYYCTDSKDDTCCKPGTAGSATSIKGT